MTVYVVQNHTKYNRDTGIYEPVFDLSPAASYGPLIFLLSPSAAPWSGQSIVADLHAGLADFSDDDYLLMVGNPVLCSMAAAIASDRNEGRIKFLQWHGKDRRYIPIEVQLFGEDEAPELG